MASKSVSISIDELRVGVTCSHPIEDDHGLLLLGAGTQITQQVIGGLRDRGILVIEVDPRDVDSLCGGQKKRRVVKRERVAEAPWAASRPVKDMLVDRYHEDLSDERAEQLESSIARAKERLDQLRTKLGRQTTQLVGEFNDISRCYAQSMVEDHDQTVGQIGAMTEMDDPEARSVRMAVLGMAVAIEMGLDGPQTLEVGMTGLLHDIGLYAMDPKFRKPAELMSDAEQWEYRKHPLISVLCVADAMEVPAAVQLAMQQVHEQFDGSGYPRGVKGHRIHNYARILNVVDAYIQLTSATQARRAIVPHDALGLMLHQASRGIFDPKVMRAFLNIETLFPLGSMVELSSGQLARVIRRPRSGFSSPVLQDMSGKRIELESTNLEVVRPVCDPEVDQMRLLPERMQASQWHPADHAIVV